MSPRRKPKRRGPKPMEKVSTRTPHELGDGEVAELVDEHHDAENDAEFNEILMSDAYGDVSLELLRAMRHDD